MGYNDNFTSVIVLGLLILLIVVILVVYSA